MRFLEDFVRIVADPQVKVMKFFKSLSVLLAITAGSSYAMAEGGGDRTFARMEQARQIAIASYQADQKNQAQELAAKETSAKHVHANC
jgi:hypothetical protein